MVQVRGEERGRLGGDAVPVDRGARRRRRTDVGRRLGHRDDVVTDLDGPDVRRRGRRQRTGAQVRRTDPAVRRRRGRHLHLQVLTPASQSTISVYGLEFIANGDHVSADCLQF